MARLVENSSLPAFRSSYFRRSARIQTALIFQSDMSKNDGAYATLRSDDEKPILRMTASRIRVYNNPQISSSVHAGPRSTLQLNKTVLKPKDLQLTNPSFWWVSIRKCAPRLRFWSIVSVYSGPFNKRLVYKSSFQVKFRSTA
jgi:hypothetical protein